jgi:membrane associated rhomboid family serine protease
MTYNVHKVIPISDINPARNTPVISRIFMFATVGVFLLIQPKNQIELFNFFYQYSAIPCELVNFSPISESQFYNNDCFNNQSNSIVPEKNLLISVISANFFHANFIHILGNLWSFWIFGNNVEDKLGKFRFIIFLIFIGIISISVHTYLNQDSLIPIVGASGIVSGLMGAYVFMFPNARLLVLVPFGFLFPTTIKAKFFMVFWFLSQILISISDQNISWEAHVGGFVFGYLLLRIFNNKRYNV